MRVPFRFLALVLGVSPMFGPPAMASVEECGPQFRGDPASTAIAALRDVYGSAVTGDVLESRLAPGLVEALGERGLPETWLADGVTGEALGRLEIFDMHGARRERAVLYARAGDHQHHYLMVCVEQRWRIEWLWSEATGTLNG